MQVIVIIIITTNVFVADAVILAAVILVAIRFCSYNAFALLPFTIRSVVLLYVLCHDFIL